MRVLVLGATGRVGSEAVARAAAQGHKVRAFVRDPARFQGSPNVELATGDLLHPETLAQALALGTDAVINAVGVDPLKPSTFVTDAARVVVAAMEAAGVMRYTAVSGTANMPKTLFGSVAAAILRLTPVRYAIRDHWGAYRMVSNSKLTWTLAGCPWIKDGPPSAYAESDIFSGGKKTISPANVADFLVKVLERPEYDHRIVGIWNTK